MPVTTETVEQRAIRRRLDKLAADQPKREVWQEAINAAIDHPGGEDEAIKMAREQAAEDHIEFPQYDGYWDDWTLGRITRDIDTKAGRQFNEGDIVMHKRGDIVIPEWPDQVSAYSVRTTCNVNIDPADIEPLA